MLALYESSSDQGSCMSSDVSTLALKMPSRGKGRFRGKDHKLHSPNAMFNMCCSTAVMCYGKQ